MTFGKPKQEKSEQSNRNSPPTLCAPYIYPTPSGGGNCVEKDDCRCGASWYSASIADPPRHCRGQDSDCLIVDNQPQHCYYKGNGWNAALIG